MVKRPGHRAGSSARNDVLVLVKSALGEADRHARSMPALMFAEITSMAWPRLLCSDGPGQVKEPREQRSLPSTVARLRTTFPVDSKSWVRRTEPLTFAWTRLSV